VVQLAIVRPLRRGVRRLPVPALVLNNTILAS
jgi:hypothetical protein